MTEYCRLCAESKHPSEIATSIGDVEQSMERKLRACCQWTTENTEHRLPHSVCAICLDKLDKCWLFSQSVQLAQQRLLEIFEKNTEVDIEAKPLATEMVQIVYDCPDYSSQPEDKPSSSRKKKKKSKKVNPPESNEVEANELDEQTSVHKCPECGKRFRKRWNLTEHMQQHSSERPFECWLCHKLFKTRRTLRFHVKGHVQIEVKTKEKKSSSCICELCGKTFKENRRLNDHLQSSHSNQRPFKCDICGMGYKLKRSLKSHQITHMEYQHKCTQCEKAFRKRTSLTKHMEYHRGPVAKPFVCDFCGKGFRFNANYAEHRRIHTGETPYECEYCSSKFRTMSSFYTHLKKAHGIAKSVLNLEQRARLTAMSTSMVEQPPEIPK